MRITGKRGNVIVNKFHLPVNKTRQKIASSILFDESMNQFINESSSFFLLWTFENDIMWANIVISIPLGISLAKSLAWNKKKYWLYISELFLGIFHLMRSFVGVLQRYLISFKPIFLEILETRDAKISLCEVRFNPRKVTVYKMNPG